MRALQPGWLIELDSGLWAVDAVQPVAAVLDPGTAAVRRIVSWPQVPPRPVHTWGSTVLGDGTSLWVQHAAGGPVVRIDTGGVAAAGWVGGELARQRLAACGPGVAWCTTPPPEDEHVRTGERPGSFLGFGELRRVGSDGVVDVVAMDRGVQRVQADERGLLVGAVADTWSVRRWESDVDRVNRNTRWYRIPWQVDPPQLLGDQFALPPGFTPPPVPDPMAVHGQHFEGQGPAARTPGVDWYVESSPQLPVNGPLWQRMAVTARVASGSGAGNVVASWDLGDGSVGVICPVGGRVALTVTRGPRTAPQHQRGRVVDVLLLDPRDGSRTTLLPGGSVEVGEHCWPLEPAPECGCGCWCRSSTSWGGRWSRSTWTRSSRTPWRWGSCLRPSTPGTASSTRGEGSSRRRTEAARRRRGDVEVEGPPSLSAPLRATVMTAQSIRPAGTPTSGWSGHLDQRCSCVSITTAPTRRAGTSAER
ncbi:hypothetical protein MO973_38210 [Paenibacillus sp. TRM 82003]|uniref:hypothetical protein n=1 Tax=Kineococcus sp. TRM81007 TaxID=2925831 RepID=UPI001F56B415|nr:hypothetical protein [Kineococcus sp. TRM81007]MCI2238025.1 hypothetical protein [Kineococcus sp. TRM81007]MCI3926040.1 hypothetical protein [Paenibacillus sp. TRM 82003]